MTFRRWGDPGGLISHFGREQSRGFDLGYRGIAIVNIRDQRFGGKANERQRKERRGYTAKDTSPLCDVAS